MRLKLATAAAAATALLGLAALSTPAMAAKMIDHEQPLVVPTTYFDPIGGTSGFAAVNGNTYFIDFTLPATDSLLTISSWIEHKLPGFGPGQDFTADTFDLYNGTAVSCGTNCVTGVLGKVTPIQVLASLNAKAYDLSPSKSDEHFVIEVFSKANGQLQGDIEIAAVPEPATWAMIMLGVGMIGLAARRRRDALAFA